MAARGYGPKASYALAQNGWDKTPLNPFYGRMGGKFLATGFNPLLLPKQGEISNHWLEIATFISFNPLPANHLGWVCTVLHTLTHPPPSLHQHGSADMHHLP